MKVLVLDIEGDGLYPSEIHMLGVLDYVTDEFTNYNGDAIADGLCEIDECDILLVYNKDYDIKHIKRLTENVVSFKEVVIIDVLELSRKYVKFLPNNKLKTWGDYFDFPKGDHNDWSKYSPEMGVYCERDCRLTKKVFDFICEMLLPSKDILLEAIEDAQRKRQIL
jgi:hypothetical protein